MRARLLPALFVAALLVFLQSRSGTGAGVLTVVLMALFAYVVLAGGRLLAIAAGMKDGDPSTAWTLGLLAVCLAIYALTLLLPVTAGGAFGVIVVAVAVAEFAFRRQSFQPDSRALAGFAVAVLLTAAWCFEPARAYEVVRTQGYLPLWSDYFFQGGLISQFGDPRALGRGSIYLADHPPSFYHFASYGAAAAFARILDQPGLPLAAAAWLPLGFLAMLAGGHALGARLAGPAGGIAALAALALLPDASNYGLRNGWFSFHWTLFAHAGAAYALGAAFLSLALLGGSRRALAASALLALSTLLFRAHIFVLLMPAWVAAAVVCHATREQRRTRTAWLMLAALAACAGGASLLTDTLAEHGFWRMRAGSALVDFLLYVHTDHEPTAYTGVYERLRLLDQPALQLAAGIGLAFAAALGAFLLALPAAALAAWRRRAMQPIDVACGYLLACWLLLMLFAPTPWHGDPSDLIHRPFVLLYGACATWTLCLLLRVFDGRSWRMLFGATLLALPWIFVAAGPMAQPKFRWSAFDAAVRLPPGLVEAAQFMRANSAPGDTFAAAGLKLAYQTFDLSTQLVALSGVPAYLSRPHFETIKDAPRRQLVLRRLEALRQVESLGYEDAMRLLRSLNVRWYVVAGNEGPGWDPAHAAFRSGTVALYRTP